MAKKNVPFPEVAATDAGFQFAGVPHLPLEIPWRDVVEIEAFKRVVFSYEVVALGFRVSGTEEFIEVTEEFPGFENLVKVVESQFSLAENWRCNVGFPAFRTRFSTIWISKDQT